MRHTPRVSRAARWALLCCALASAAVGAVSLGEPRVDHQERADGRWVVELPLASLGKVAPDQIQARLAPAPAWAAVGLTVLSPDDVRVQVVPSAGAGVVRLDIRAQPGFVDVLLELQWPNGRMQREVSLLLGAGEVPGFVPRVGVPASVWVQKGDTASHVVAHQLGASVPLAQGLLALQQANPDAFEQGNVNRLRAGAVLELPSREQILATNPVQASEFVARQMEEFAMYRAELAAQSGTGTTDSAQVATGKVQAANRDKPEAPADRLTLSAPGADAQSDQVAQQREAQQAADRAQELNRNIQELNRLAQSAGGGLPAPAAVPDTPTSGLIDRLVEAPWTPLAALALALLLAAGVVWRALRRTSVSGDDAEPGLSVTPLRVDFDLNLPRVDELPPLPPEVLQAPTPAARPASGRDATSGPAPGANPMAGLSLDLNAPPPAPPAAPAPPTQVPDDPWELRLALAQALWARGLSQTALVLAREVATQAPAEQAAIARSWLDERV